MNCILFTLSISSSTRFTKMVQDIKHICKELVILKSTDILKVQNCLFKYHVKQNNAVATYFSVLYSRDKHNYQTRSATHNLLVVPLTRTNKECKRSVKYKCIRNWNSFKNRFPQIPENDLSNMKIKEF